MADLFYVAGALAVLSTVLAITRAHAVHALLYVVISLFNVAIIFFLLGATLAAALELIVFAGAIMVLVLFVIMLLEVGRQQEPWRATTWLLPGFFAAALLVELTTLALRVGGKVVPDFAALAPRQVSVILFGPYLLGVEMAGLLLLAGMVGALQLGRELKRSAGDS